MKKKEAKPNVVTESAVEEDIDKNDDDDGDNDINKDDDDDDKNNDDNDDNNDNDNMENNNDSTRTNTQGNNNNGISPERNLRGFDNKAHLRLRIIGFLECLVR